jgi:AcrR family transcriptional regulator
MGNRTHAEYFPPHGGVSSRQCEDEVWRQDDMPGRRQVVMGVTPPSLYATFGSKEDLYQQALDHNIERETKRRSEALQGEMPAYDAIAFYLHDVAHCVTDPSKPRGCIISTAVLQHAKENETVARAVAARRAASILAMKTRFDRAISEGELPTGTDTDALARFYSAVVQGMSAQACDGASTATLRRLADIALSAWPGTPA